MPRKGNVISYITVAAVFIVLETAATVMVIYNGRLQNTWFMKGVHGFMSVVWGKTESIRDYFSLKKENARLAEENYTLLMELRKIAADDRTGGSDGFGTGTWADGDGSRSRSSEGAGSDPAAKVAGTVGQWETGTTDGRAWQNGLRKTGTTDGETWGNELRNTGTMAVGEWENGTADGEARAVGEWKDGTATGEARAVRQRKDGTADGVAWNAGERGSDAAEGPDTAGRYRYIPAEIGKISNNRQHNYMIIDKGRKDGVQPMSGVITRQGAVGIIDAVSDHYSFAISFCNHDMTVSARLGREGATGTLVWTGTDTRSATLDGIPHHIAVSAGDTVFTSGFSAIFPPDIPLGTTGEKRLVNGSSFSIDVTLFEDFRRLRYVTIVSNIDKTEIEGLEGLSE